MLRRIFAIYFIAAAHAALAVTPLDEDASPGIHALRFKRAPATWNGLKAVTFDGSVTDDQSGSQNYDRRVAGGCAFGFEQPVMPNLSTRLDLRGEAVTRRQKMGLEPKTMTEESYIVGRPSVDVTYITPASLELFAGGTYILNPSFTETIESSSVTAENKYSSNTLFVPRFGLTRRSGVANGGVYYVSGRESSRTVIKSAGDGNDLTFSVPVFEPTTAALFAEFAASGFNWTIEVAAISGSEGGLRSASGSTMSDDHMRVRRDLFGITCSKRKSLIRPRPTRKVPT